MNEQLLKDFLATAKKDNYNWDVILPKFPELKDYDLRLLKDYAATAKKDNYDYSIINPKFPEFNLEKQEGGEPVNFTEGSVEQPGQPTEPLKKPIVKKDLFKVTESEEYLAGPRKEQEEYLKSISGLIKEEDTPSSKLVSQYSAYDPIQLDSALIDIGKRKQILQSNIRGPGISKREKLNKLEEEYAAAIVYKAEKTNDYDLSDDARRAVIDIGHSSPLGKKLRPEVYKLENRISEDIFKEVESRGVEFYSLTEEDYNGVRRADAEKVGVLADEIAESIAKGNPGVRQVAYERIFERAENEEEIKMNEEKIKSDPEIQDIFSRYRSEGLDEFESTNKDGIKYKAEYTSAANSINKSAEFKLNKLTTDYNSDVNSYKQDLISQIKQGVITPEEAEKQLGDYNKQLYSDLQNTENLIIQNNNLNLQELTTEYSKKIEGGFKEFLQNNPMDPDDLQKLNDAVKRIGEEVDKDRFGKLKDQEMMSIYKYGATELIPLFGKSLWSTLGRSVSGAGTFNNIPWMVELGDEMNTAYSVADERVEDWSDLANIPSVTKSIGRLAGSALPSILVGTAVSASTGGLGTIPAMALVAGTGWMTESIDMAGNIKRDVIRETGSLLKGEQAAGAMWEAQLGNWWTYVFDGLPYVGKALRAVPSRAARIAISGTESALTETPQETFQTSQEQQIMQTVFDETEITAKGFSDRINQKLVKETFLEVAPGSFALGGGGRAVTEFMMDRQADKLVKEMVAKTRAGLVDDNESFIRQKIFASMNQFGKNFTNSWLSTLQKNGSITEEDLNRLYTYSKTAEGFLRNVNGLNLTEEQNNTYFALSHRANELYNQAESITDDKVTRSTITEQANALKKNAQEFLNNPETGGSFVSVQIGKGPALIMNEEQAIEFVTNNPYVAFPEAGINIQGRNVDEFTKMFSEMVEGTKAGLADVKSIDEYSNQQREEGRLSSVDNTLTKINNAEYINDNEINSSIDQIFDEIDRVDGLDISDNAKESIKQQLFSVAEILDNHEFRTKTETRKVTPKESAEGGAETKREIPKKSTSKAELAGVGTVSVTFTGGNTISITPQGQKGRAARVTTFTFPENFLYTNEQGDFTALIIEDAEGNEITINDPEIGVPLAINNIIAETAAVPTDVVEEFVTEEINYIKERKEADPEAKEAAPVKDAVEESTTEGVESSEGLTEEAESELRKLMGLDKSKRKESREGKTEKDNQRLDKVERAVDLLKKSLSKVMPNIFIDVAESSEQFALFAEEEGYKKRDLSQGIFRKMPVPDSKTFEEEWVIILNPDSADVATVFHEGLHAMLRASGLSNDQARAATGRMIDAVKKTATKKLQRELKEFTEMYETPQQNEEYIAELIGILANNYNEQNNETKSLIRRWLEKLAEILGLKPMGAPLSSVGLGKTDAATVNMLNVLAEKMSRGKVLSKEDVTSLRMGGPLTVQQVAADMRMDEEQGGSGQVGNFNFKRKKSKAPSKAPSVEDDTRSYAKNTIQKDLTTYAGQNFLTNMYDFTDSGKKDIGGGIVLDLYGGKNYPALMMERTGTKFGEVSNIAAFNSKENAEGFIKNAIDGKANLFAPHVGTKEGSWQFQQNIFEQLVEKLLDNNVITNEELIESFNSGLNSKDGKDALRIFNEKNKTNLTNLNDFIENPKKLVELLDIDNNYSADLRKILNDKIASNKKVQKFLGVTNKIEFAELLEDPMNVGSKPFDLIGLIEFDNTTFEKPSRPKKGDADYHPSFAWTVKAKIKAIVQPTYFYQSTESTDSYTKFNQDGVVVSRLTDLKDSKGRSLEKLYKTALKDTRKYKINEQGKKVIKSGKAPFDGTFEDFQKSKFKSSNVASSAGSLPKVATVKPIIRKQKRRTKPKSKIKDAFEYGIQKGIPAINIKNWLIKLGYTEEEVDSGAYDAERIWNKDGKKVKNWFESARRSALSARKFRPQSMFLAKEAMESAISAELRQAKMMAESLNSAINRYKSQDKRDELIDAVDEFMRDAEERDFWRDELPDEIAQIAEAMRIHIDSLSLKLVEVGAIKAESSRENIRKNIGVYMNRSFEIFDNKNWKKEVGDQVITAAQNHLREAYYNSLSGINELDQQLKDDKITESDYNRRKNRILANKASVKEIMDRDGVTEDEALTMHVEKVVDDILTRKDVDEYISFAQSVVGKKDLSSLKRRKDIPPAIRALMGEYTDPGYNYAMSIFKIANLVENQKYLTKIRDAGLGVWLFEDEAGIKKREGYKQITFDGDASMNPLDGLYAPEAVADAFNDKELSTIISGIPVIGTPYKTYLKFVGGVKYSKTILSFGTHAKNVIGNMYFMAQNGYLDPREYQQPFMVLAKQFAGKELTAEQEAKMDEWIRAGIIGQGASIGEIKSIFEGEDSFEKALSKRIDKKTDNMLSEGKKGVKWVGKKAQEAYQYEDDMFKIVAYEKEKLNYSKILFDGKSYNQLDASQKSAVNDYVAEIIKNILPNYGRIGGFGKFLKAVPVAGTFISFQLEAYRTAYNTVGLAMQEIKGDIPGISEAGKKLAQKRGAKRLASIVGFQAFKYGMIALLGIPLIPGDDDDEDGLLERIRMLLPFWDTNSDIAIQDVKPNGNFTYISVSASDPYGSIFKVVNATTNYAKTGEGGSEIFKELLGPFVSEDILLNTLRNVSNNENNYGGKLWRKTDTAFEVSEKITLEIYKAFEPGTISSTKKIIQSENKLNEVIGQFTGFKLHEIKSLEQAEFKFREIQNEAQESKKAYNSVKYNIDDYETQEDINKVIRASKKAMDKDYKEAVKLYQALISLGVSKRDIRAKMDDAGISSTMRSQIARNSIDVKLNAIKK